MAPRDAGESDRERGKPQTFDDPQIEVLAAHCRNWRKKRGLSQAEMGDLLRVGQQAISRIESKRGPSYFTATRLARLFGHRGVDDFFYANGVAVPDEGNELLDWLPARAEAAEKMIAAGQLDAEIYEEIRRDSSFNEQAHAIEPESFWRAVFVMAQRAKSA